MLKDLALVQETLWEARTKWYDIGLGLKIMPTELEAIDKECGRDIELCFRKMLYNWLSRSSARQKCTWRAIINVLKTKVIHLESLANQIEAEKGYNSDLITDDRPDRDIKSHLVPETFPGSTEDEGKVFDCLTCL